MSKIQKKSQNLKKSREILKNCLFSKIWNLWKIFVSGQKKKCYPLSFPIVGILSSTRALQTSPLQNTGGVAWAWHRRSSRSIRTVLLLSNIGYQSCGGASVRSLSPPPQHPRVRLLTQSCQEDRGLAGSCFSDTSRCVRRLRVIGGFLGSRDRGPGCDEQFRAAFRAAACPGAARCSKKIGLLGEPEICVYFMFIL